MGSQGSGAYKLAWEDTLWGEGKGTTSADTRPKPLRARAAGGPRQAEALRGGAR